MLLILVGLAFAIPVLWTVSVGALRELGRARGFDPRRGCQAWVAVPGLAGRRYRCCEPVYASGTWCRAHEVALARGELATDHDAVLIDESQAVGRALAQARIGLPLGLVAVVGVVALVVWAVQRAA